VSLFSFSHARQSHCGLAQLRDEFNFDPALVERYIELMCEFSPQNVYPYITSSEGYRLENAIKVNKVCYELQLVGSFNTCNSSDNTACTLLLQACPLTL
jgi:hypothetical protein